MQFKFLLLLRERKPDKILNDYKHIYYILLSRFNEND